MKPFSPLYFIRQNKSRCILLMLMIFLSYGVYLGGLYVSNPGDNWSLYIDYYKDIATISVGLDDDNCSEYEAFRKEIEANDKITVLETGEWSGLHWNTIMGFDSGICSFTFKSVDDFKTYCEYMDIECNFDNIKNGSFIMSEMFAKNKNLKIGDKIDKNYHSYIYDEYSLDALTQEKGYVAYFINDEFVGNHPTIMLLGNGIRGNELYDIIYEVQSRHNVYVYDTLKDEVEPQFEIFNTIYNFVVIFLSIILAITINAAFVGMYQRRNFEFAVYRAIGISKRRVIGKIIGELLWIDLITLVIGGAVFFLGLYLFNNMVLYPIGKYLEYFHPTALFGLILSNVMVVLPLIITRCRQMLKADICDY